MKTPSVPLGRMRRIARLGCGIAITAGLTFTVLSASAAPAPPDAPTGGATASVSGAGCMDYCRSRLYQCLASGTDKFVCMGPYNYCAINCTASGG